MSRRNTRARRARHPLRDRLAQTPGMGLAFWNTTQSRRELGYATPHALAQHLQRLRHGGYVVLQGEGFSNALNRVVHAQAGDHNWQPDRVVIVPRALFHAAMTQARLRWPGKQTRASVSSFCHHPKVLHVGGPAIQGGGITRVRGEFLAALREERSRSSCTGQNTQ